MKYEDIMEKIIDSAMKVHSTLGNGSQEVIYQCCPTKELSEAGLNFQREIEMPIHYRGQEVGTRRADFFVEDKIQIMIFEMKRLPSLFLIEVIH